MNSCCLRSSFREKKRPPGRTQTSLNTSGVQVYEARPGKSERIQVQSRLSQVLVLCQFPGEFLGVGQHRIHPPATLFTLEDGARCATRRGCSVLFPPAVSGLSPSRQRRSLSWVDDERRQQTSWPKLLERCWAYTLVIQGVPTVYTLMYLIVRLRLISYCY